MTEDNWPEWAHHVRAPLGAHRRGWAEPVRYPDGSWAVWDFSEHRDSATEISMHATYAEALAAAERWAAWAGRKVVNPRPTLAVIGGGT